MFVNYIAYNVPGIAYVIFNKPCDFMLCFNKYPESFATVSIIQYKKFHVIYDNTDILKYLDRNNHKGMFGNNILSPFNPKRGTSYAKAERLFKDSEIIDQFAGSVLEESESPYLQATGEWAHLSRSKTYR